ncbi:hypothetical protein MRX96_032174 [Rhipicephalus microplus]
MDQSTARPKGRHVLNGDRRVGPRRCARNVVAKAWKARSSAPERLNVARAAVQRGLGPHHGGSSSASRRELSSHYRLHSGKPLQIRGEFFARRNSIGPVQGRERHPSTQAPFKLRVALPRGPTIDHVARITTLRHSVRSGSPRHAALVFMHQEEMDRWRETPGALIYARPPASMSLPALYVHGRENVCSPLASAHAVAHHPAARLIRSDRC